MLATQNTGHGEAELGGKLGEASALVAGEAMMGDSGEFKRFPQAFLDGAGRILNQIAYKAGRKTRVRIVPAKVPPISV